jgi:hypothetical protein
MNVSDKQNDHTVVLYKPGFWLSFISDGNIKKSKANNNAWIRLEYGMNTWHNTQPYT